MQNNTELLHAMLDDQNRAQAVYRPGPYWAQYSKRTADAILKDGIETFRSNSKIGKGYADTVLKDPFELYTKDSLKHKVHKLIRNNVAVQKYFIDPYRKQNLRHFREFQKYRDLYYTHILGDWFEEFCALHPSLPETLIGQPGDVVHLNGRKIGLAYLISFLRIHNYSTQIDFTKINSVFEIGGGFGAFAHSLMHLYPNIKTFAYLDIPPIIYVGTQYLRHFYPQQVRDYTQTRSLKSIGFKNDDERSIVALCPWQIERLEHKFDLFWNSASFQEMSSDVVTNYAGHFDRLMHDNATMCLMAYRNGDPSSTIVPDALVKLIEENSSFKPKSFAPDFDLYEDYYYIGRKV